MAKRHNALALEFGVWMSDAYAGFGCKRGGDTQGEACFNVSYLGSDSVSSKVQPSCTPCMRWERGSGMQGEAV